MSKKWQTAVSQVFEARTRGRRCAWLALVPSKNLFPCLRPALVPFNVGRVLPALFGLLC